MSRIPTGSTDRGDAPTSRAQASMWFLCQLSDSAVYNLPSAVRLRGELDGDALARAFTTIASRHAVLRTCFVAQGGHPRQRIQPVPGVQLEQIDCTGATDPEAEALTLALQAASQTFDLSAAPPWRAVLVRIAAADHLLLLIHHHLVWDGWSIGLLVGELATLYGAETSGRPQVLPPVRHQYADYAVWQNARIEAGALEPSIAWWRTTLQGVTDLALPTDRPRPAVQTHVGAILPVQLEPSVVQALEAATRAAGGTLFMGLMSAFAASLSRWTGTPRFALGVPNANRGEPAFHGTIGYFANLLVLPFDLADSPSFAALLARVRDTTLLAFEHQEVPFDTLVERLGVPRDPARNPLFQVTFALHAENLWDLELGDLDVEPVTLGTPVTHFDLGLHLWRRDGRVVGYLSYNRDLFDPSSMQQLARGWTALLQAVVEQPGIPLSDVTWQAEQPAVPVPFVAPRLDAPGVLVGDVRLIHQLLGSRTLDAAVKTVVITDGYVSASLATRLARSLRCEVVYGYAPPEVGEPVAWARVGPGGTGSLALTPARSIALVHAGQPVSVGFPGVVVVDGIVTADTGRWTDDGRVRLDPPRQLWAHGKRWSLPVLEGAVTRLPGIRDAALQLREHDGQTHVVAWVVADRREGLDARIASVLPAVPFVAVRVDRIPRQVDGEPDLAGLLGLPVVDASILAGLVRSDTAPVLRPVEHPTNRLHLADLAPGHRVSEAVESHSTVRAGEGELGSAGPLAYAHGGELHIPPGAPTTLTACLRHWATSERAHTHGITVIDADGSPVRTTYAELWERARTLLGGLRTAGLRPGDRVVLQLASLTDHFIGFWACILGGITPVTVAQPPGYDARNAVLDKLWNVWTLLGHPVILTTDDRLAPLQRARSLFDAPETPAWRCLGVSALSHGEPASIVDPDPEDVAFLQLSSGSTGIPKCIQETHRAVLAHVWGAAAFNGYTEEDRSFNWLPMDHVVPTLTSHCKDVVLGLDQVHAATASVLVDPLRWLDWMEAYRTTLSWAPNFGFKLVADALATNPERSWDLSAVRYLMNAGEQVTLPVVQAFLERTAPFGLSERTMQPAYGMAEVATAVCYSSAFSLANAAHAVAKSSLKQRLQIARDPSEPTIAFIDLGPPIPGVEFRIVGPGNTVLPENVIGSVHMRGRVTMPGYLNNPAANAESFVGEGWFDSGDLGFLRDGRLSITGRKKEMIIVRGANFYCYEVEDVVDAIEGVEPTFSGVCSVDDPASGTEGLAVFHVPRSGRIEPALIEAIRTRITQDFGVAPTLVLPLTTATFPKTTSGKIQRNALKSQLADGGFDALIREVDLACANGNTVPDWFYAVHWRRRDALASADELPTTTLIEPSVAELLAEIASLAQRPDPCRLFVVAAGSLSTSPDRAVLRGLLQTVPQELPHVDVRLIDPGPDEPTAIVAAELACGHREPLVRWEHGERWVPGLARATFDNQRGLPFEPGAFLVITGGLGGIGLRLARHLLLRFQVRLLLLGRTDLDGEGVPNPDGLGLAASVDERREALAALHRLPGLVRYAAVDVADPAALEQAIRSVGWGDPVGAFHLAGVFPTRLLVDETPASVDEVLAPKAGGCTALDRVLPHDAWIVAFSSVYGTFGAAASGAYGAANAWVDAWAAGRTARGSRTHALAFSNWDELGMSRGYAFREASEALGFRMVAPAEGIASLFVALSGGPDAVVIGLDPARTPIRALLHEPVAAADRLTLFTEPSAPTLDALDRFGRPVPVDRIAVPSLPRLADGTVDSRALLAGGQAPRALVVVPRNHLERTIAAIWLDVLGLETLDIDETFFALGGQSIQLLVVLDRLEQKLARKLSIVEFFRHPSVRALAHHLGQSEQKQTLALDRAAERGAKARAARHHRPPPRTR